MDDSSTGESALSGRSRSAVFLGILAAEALYAAGRVHQLLFAGKEGMARGADFNADVAAMGGAGDKGIAAGTMDAHFVISGMNSWLHMIFRPQYESLDSTGRPRDSANAAASRASGRRSA